MIPYKKLAKNYNELHRQEQLKKAKLIIKLLDIKHETVLDVGCGTAIYSDLFKNYTGIDNCKEMLKLSKANTMHAQAEKLPFKDQSFEIVISITAAHNFKDIKKAIQEIKRVSKRKIAISVLKKSKKLKQIENQLKGFKRVEEEKDIIFYKTTPKRNLAAIILYNKNQILLQHRTKDAPGNPNKWGKS